MSLGERAQSIYKKPFIEFLWLHQRVMIEDDNGLNIKESAIKIVVKFLGVALMP